MGSQFMDIPSPRGVHVPEAYYVNDADDPYHRPSSRRNRYSRTTQQTPRVRDVTWISSPDPITPQTPFAPPAPWLPLQQAPPTSPGPRPPSAIPPSPAPTVGEHMNVDDFTFGPDDSTDTHRRPQRPSLLKSFWKGLKKLSGYRAPPLFPIPRQSSYASQTVRMPMPGVSVPSEATQYVDPTPPETSETDERRSPTPNTSPYARPASVGGTPAAMPSPLRTSPAPAPSVPIAPPITVISPSASPSPPRPNSIRSARAATPGPGRRSLSVGFPEPVGSTEEASQTLYDHGYPNLAQRQPQAVPAAIPVTRSDDDDDEIEFPLPIKGGILKAPSTQQPAIQGPVLLATAIQATQVDRSYSKNSLPSAMARFRRFVAELDDLPWMSDAQIADEYIPEQNPRSRMRARVRQGAEPSWYNPRPEVVGKPEYWAEWDMWAKQSAAAFWDGTVWGDGQAGWAGIGAGGRLGQEQEQWGPVYPHGYTPVQPGLGSQIGHPFLGLVSEQGHAPVIP